MLIRRIKFVYFNKFVTILCTIVSRIFTYVIIYLFIIMNKKISKKFIK